MCEQMLMALRYHWLKLNQPSHAFLCILVFLAVWLTIQILLVILDGLSVDSETLFHLGEAEIETANSKVLLQNTSWRVRHKLQSSPRTFSQDIQSSNKDLEHQIKIKTKDSQPGAPSSEWESCLKEVILSPHVLQSSVTCDAECSRFQTLMSSWPNAKPKAVIYYLTKANRVDALSDSLKLLYRNFVQQFRYPVIVFHEKDIEVGMRNLFRSLFHFDLFFQEVQFSLPRHVNRSLVTFDIKCFSHISYRHMCHFQAKGVYDQPIFSQLEYVWRLDDDSQVVDIVPFDVFDLMRTRRLQYGYIKIHTDAFICTEGLWDATNYYIKHQNIVPKFFQDWPEPTIYYNNFEISSLAVWHSSNYQNYIKFIDCLGGIYYTRWGDAPIKSIAVSLFVEKAATYQFASLAYRHGHFFRNSSYSSF